MDRVARLACAVALTSAAACDPFGAARCTNDAACPAATPFCVDGACTATQPGPRAGCASDGDCGDGLCVDDDGTAFARTCVPPSDSVDDCATALDEATRVRDPRGPALFDVITAPGSGGCAPSFNLSFRYLDRDGDMPLPSEFVEVLFVRVAHGGFASASALVAATVDGDDPKHAAAVVDEQCAEASEPVAVWLEDGAHHRSNVVCVAPP